MNLNIKILNFNEDNTCSSKIISIDKKGKVCHKIYSNLPCVLIVCGKGILSRSYEAVSDRIISNVDLMWERNGDTITFVRREQITKEENNFSQYLFVKLSADYNEDIVLQCLVKFNKEYFTFKEILNNSILQHSIYLKLRVPVLATLFIIIVVNFVVSGYLTKESAKIIEGIKIEKVKIDNERKRSDEELQLKQTISRQRELSNSEMIDSILKNVPLGIVLHFLSIDTIQKRLENGREPLCADNKIIIKGIGQKVSDLSDWISNINSLHFIKATRIEHITKEDKGENVFFDITIEI